ncbi:MULTISPECIES: hypothetical protein [unclassified Planococcus (in: firmicutes)]|uniref:hypothetical protein n=1 Tax=Planococcus TaxID=1372 RepID=UPI000C339486|nr:MULTISPECIES: hypothetical protein [unclassified Planococcus (in: firmicutes)]AUD14515.1 hypothetical protein CW734_13710 [Planococcus sp. MB-3u-03]PKG44798.1 hypothetical protein CXF66_13250 [Planococcus sp. Urea-trap-24]PKG87140.1 hypothetical protein CXF91_14090 [Planococcus sp. Urea-3u-39]PKH40244.1 hypothetical protein CXF77_08365 [Planococcus sp. MB-3u-09]
MYKYLLYIPVLIILAFVIWTSFIATGLKIAFSVIILMFFLTINKYLSTKSTVFRKIKAAFYASLFPIAIALLLDSCTVTTYNGIDFADVYFLASLFLIFLFGSVVYGVPVSLLSDFATSDVKRYRFPLAFLIHVGFAVFSYLFLGPLMFFALFVAVVFFLFDELLRKREITRSFKSLA